MKILCNDSGFPIKMWVNVIEITAIEQAINLSNLPFAFRHVALMPDAHSGYGMPIGGVLATKNVVIPNAVGVDIGCGVLAARFRLKRDAVQSKLQEVVDEIKKVVPVGFNKQPQGVTSFDDLPIEFDNVNHMDVIPFHVDNAVKSLGTLGGGNHFIEIQVDATDSVWVMIHSGSRNLGKVVAEHHNNVAKDLNAEFYSTVPASYDLAFLPLNSVEGRKYMEEMNVCVKFADANRRFMFAKIVQVFQNFFGNSEIEFLHSIHHNYACIENHFGQNVVVHRKGATSAKKDEIGIIPGSQGTASYIVRGLGNKESFMSCSHGAGRKMSRTKAKNELDLQEQIAILDEQGIIHSMNDTNSLDEAPGAYKDIDEVMNNQSDLVDILEKLNPIAVIKG